MWCNEKSVFCYGSGKKKKKRGSLSVSSLTKTTSSFSWLIKFTWGGVRGKQVLGIAEVYSGCNGIKLQLAF